MATIGLSNLYYAKITEAANTGYETYSTPTFLAKAISADLSIQLTEANLYADDHIAEALREFQSGTLSLKIADLSTSAAADLTGAEVDDAGILVFAGEDASPPVAVGFRARKPNGMFRYFWLPRVKFGVPSTSLKTKADGVEFATPVLEGVIMVRNKPDERGKRPWKIEASEGDPAVAAATLAAWFTAVPEPDFGSMEALNGNG
jgi:phi13 family phage major tail protein